MTKFASGATNCAARREAPPCAAIVHTMLADGVATRVRLCGVSGGGG